MVAAPGPHIFRDVPRTRPNRLGMALARLIDLSRPVLVTQ